MLHPKVRMPLWAAVAIVVAAFAWRLAVQGARSFGAPELAAAVLFGGMLIVVSLIRRWNAREDVAECDRSRGDQEAGS